MPTKAKSKKTSRPQRAKTARSTAKKPAAKKAAAKRGKAASKRTGASRAATAESVKRLAEALQAHPRQKDLISAGQEKDQLLRSLIPLYLARSLGVEVTSGTTSRFWSQLGVSYAAPNAAKALRIHTGYAAETKKGRTITAKGVRYVEDAINRG